MDNVLVGTASWTDATLIKSGRFYPPEAKTPEQRLRYYASQFPLVEVDSTFYGPPALSTVETWAARTPPDFRFTAKVPQVISHDPDPTTHLPRRPLQGDGWREHLDYFLETMQPLRAKLLGLLVQLPPQWHWRPERLPVLQEFLASRRLLLDRLGDAIRRGERGEVRAISHQLAGSMALYGFGWASERSRWLEKNFSEVDEAQVRALAAQLREHLDTVEIRFAAGPDS